MSSNCDDAGLFIFVGCIFAWGLSVAAYYFVDKIRRNRRVVAPEGTWRTKQVDSSLMIKVFIADLCYFEPADRIVPSRLLSNSGAYQSFNINERPWAY
jgi:hypothetical protein